MNRFRCNRFGARCKPTLINCLIDKMHPKCTPKKLLLLWRVVLRRTRMSQFAIVRNNTSCVNRLYGRFYLSWCTSLQDPARARAKAAWPSCQTTRTTIGVLRETFDKRRLSRYAPDVNCPLRLCDLTPLEFFFVTICEVTIVYTEKPETMDNLEAKIHRAIADRRPEWIQKVVKNWIYRLRFFRSAAGRICPKSYLNTETRIIGGDLAKRGQFPYIAYMICHGRVRTQCGGSLISPGWILTAGHCLHGSTVWEITLGIIGVDRMERKYHRNSTIGIPFPGFNPRNLEHDVGLIKMPVPVTLSRYIQTIRLPSRHDVGRSLSNLQTVVSGWGQTNDGTKKLSKFLKYVIVQTISNTECARYRPPYFSIYSTTICTIGHPSRAHCYGDSGGPLVRLESDGYWTQIGIVSAGPRVCTDGPSTYTRIDFFLGWISEVTGIAIRP